MPRKKGEVLVKMKEAGIFHSDLHVVNADLTLPVPMILGHEGAGIVEEIGEGVTRVTKGDHVVLNWVPEGGVCYYCNIGRKDMCDTAQATLHRAPFRTGRLVFTKKVRKLPFSMTGTFSEFTVVSS